MRLAVVVLLFCLSAVTAAPAHAQVAGTTAPAQQPDAPAKPAAPKPPLGLRAFFLVESTGMSAADAFKAVTGSSRVTGFGVGAELHNLWKKLFLRGAVSRASASGSRAFVVGEEVIPVNIDLDVALTTTEVLAAWRTSPRTRPTLAIYAGGGMRLVSYSETSAFAEPGDDVSETGVGYAIVVGFDTALGKSRKVTAGAEVQYRIGPDLLGDAGLSGSFGERSLGGVTIRGVVGIRLR
jgi:hypothetical protein